MTSIGRTTGAAVPEAGGDGGDGDEVRSASAASAAMTMDMVRRPLWRGAMDRATWTGPSRREGAANEAERPEWPGPGSVGPSASGVLARRTRPRQAWAAAAGVLGSALLPVHVCRPRPHTGSFGTAMVATQEPAKRHPESSCDRGQDALVDGLAGFEALDRAREDAGCRCQLIDAVAERDAKAEDARRQWFYRCDAVVSIAPPRVRRRRTLEHHRLAFMQQYAASIE